MPPLHTAKDSNEEDPKVTLDEDEEVLNHVLVTTERLVTDLKVSEEPASAAVSFESERVLVGTTNYDEEDIARKYAEAKEHEWRQLIEAYSFQKLMRKETGEKSGRMRCVDLACGEGTYTRMVRSTFPEAMKTLGVDISEKMIEIATEKENNNPLGIQYVVSDVREGAVAKGNENFDLATAAWLLVYCKSRDELDEMTKSIANYVKPGGRFITIISNPDITFVASAGSPKSPLLSGTSGFRTTVLSQYSKYGFTVEVPNNGAAEDGDLISWNIETSKGNLRIENYYLPKEAYKESLQKAGFVGVKFIDFELDPRIEGSEGLTTNSRLSPFSHLTDPHLNDKEEFYQTFLDNPPCILIECVKSKSGSM